MLFFLLSFAQPAYSFASRNDTEKKIEDAEADKLFSALTRATSIIRRLTKLLDFLEISQLTLFQASGFKIVIHIFALIFAHFESEVATLSIFPFLICYFPG